jgi:hypothetical protein
MTTEMFLRSDDSRPSLILMDEKPSEAPASDLMVYI